VAVLIILSAGCATMQKHWKDAESIDTIAAYEEFLCHYPHGQLAEQARIRLELLHFEKAKDKNTRESFVDYLQQYPDGKYIDEVYSLMEIPYFKWAKDTNTFEAYERFLSIYPNSKYKENRELKWFLEGVSLNKASPGSLFIRIDEYSFNGEWGDEFIEVITPSSQKTIRTDSIISIYRDHSSRIRIRLDDGKIDERIYNLNITDFKVRTDKGGLIINIDDLDFFHALIKTPANEIGSFKIIENHGLELWKKNVASDGIIRGSIIPEYWVDKVFTLSNPVYSKMIDDSTKPLEFLFDFLKHSDIDYEIAIIFRIIIKDNEFGGYSEVHCCDYEYTSIDIQKGEIKNIKLNTDCLSSKLSLMENNFIVVLIMPLEYWKSPYRRNIHIFYTISNVLILPVEIKNGLR
jgi:hypothetical protein